jgi:hypothetical protein
MTCWVGPGHEPNIFAILQGGGGRILRGSLAHTKLNHASSSAFFSCRQHANTISHFWKAKICIMPTEENQALFQIISLNEVS